MVPLNNIHDHREKIYRSIFFKVNDKQLAEDILQDTFIKILDFANAGRYIEEGKILRYAYRIAGNLCVDHFRRLKRNPPIKTSNNFDIFEAIDADVAWADDKIVRTETRDGMQKLLEMLPTQQMEVILLRYYDDLSFKEIAKLTKCSINTCLGRARYGLINLRKMKLDQ